jgi:hypothetical protein
MLQLSEKGENGQPHFGAAMGDLARWVLFSSQKSSVDQADRSPTYVGVEQLVVCV